MFAADQDMFDIYSLEIEGDIHDFVTGDFNGDDLTDIVIVYTPLEQTDDRYLGLYLQEKPSAFRTTADYLAVLPESAVQIDVADVDGDNLDDILLIDGTGVSLIKYSIGSGLTRPARLINQNTAYAVSNFHGIVVSPFIFELNDRADGPEMVIPVINGFALFQKGSGGTYERAELMKLPINSCNHRLGIRSLSRKRSLNITMELPEVQVYDGNRDGMQDLYFLWDHKICTFFQKDGKFGADPDVSVRFFRGLPEGYLRSSLADCNGDNRPDVVVSMTSGGITNTETTIRYYMADTEGRVSSNHSREVVLSDSYCNLIVTDFDRDNVPEIMIPAVEMGAIAASKMFLLKKTDLHLLIYPVRNGLPVESPEKRFEYEFRFDFENANPTAEINLNWSADYNMDNLYDAVFSDGNGRILFFWGNRSEFLSGRPDLEVTLDHPSGLYPVKLNNGRYSDLIVDHFLSGRYDRLTVLKNRNNNF